MKYTIIYPFWQILLTKYLPCGKSMADSEPISRSYYIRSDSTGKLENIKVIFDLPGGVQTEGRFRLRPQVSRPPRPRTAPSTQSTVRLGRGSSS